jgi:predicted secreted protein
MGVVAGIVVFLLTWWIVLFAVLPFGIKHPAQQETGMMPGAPVKPDFKKIILRTTLISIVIWAVIFGLVESDVISFREWAKAMPR